MINACVVICIGSSAAGSVSETATALSTAVSAKPPKYKAANPVVEILAANIGNNICIMEGSSR